MGQDKALLPFGGYETLAEYQYRRLSLLFSSCYLGAKADKFSFGAPVILDADAIYSPTSGLLGAFEALKGDFAVLGVDMPSVDEQVFTSLFAVYREGGFAAYIAQSPRGGHPLCGIYTRKLLPALQEAHAKKRYGLHRLLADVKTRWVSFESDAPFVNLNTPEEYVRVKERNTRY